MNVVPFRRKKIEITDVIIKQEDGTIYTDFVLSSMINAVEKWYKEYYQGDVYNMALLSHINYIVNFYKRERFMDHNTIGQERLKYLEEIDLYIQMRRED
jgi:hypothetical protein